MKRRSKIALSFLLTLFVIALILNIPIMPYTDAYCHMQYESYMTRFFPCGIFEFCIYGSNVRTVTMTSETLDGGYSATASSNATSSFSFALNNPSCSSGTFVSSMSLWKGNQSIISNWDNSTGPSSAGNLIDFNLGHMGNNYLRAANVTSFVYYPAVTSGAAEPIVTGQVYNYVIFFHNGQAVSGSMIAQ